MQKIHINKYTGNIINGKKKDNLSISECMYTYF